MVQTLHFQGLFRAESESGHAYIILRRNTFLFWVPVWTLQELLKCGDLLFPQLDKESIETRYLEYGGVIRYVLVNRGEAFSELSEYLSTEQAIDLYHPKLASMKSDIRHVFAHIQVRPC